MKGQSKPRNGQGTEMPIRHLSTEIGTSVPISPLFWDHLPVSIHRDAAATGAGRLRIMQGEGA